MSNTKKTKKVAPLKSTKSTDPEPEIFREFVPCNEDQKKFLSLFQENTIIVCTGKSGSGKTACAIAAAIHGIRTGRFEQIVLMKPVVEAGSVALGFLPGNYSEKSLPYFMNMISEIEKQAGAETYRQWVQDKTIKMIPIQLLRGMTFDKSVVICDEFQNTNFVESKLIVSRLGQSSKMILNGDLKQSDIRLENGLKIFSEKLSDINGLSFVHLNTIVRHSILTEIMDRLES